MKILYIASITNPSGNGVAVAVNCYCKYIKDMADVAQLNVESDISSDVPSFNYANYKGISSLPDGFDLPDIVIFNEVYKMEYLELSKECIKKGIPYIIIPHGCLTKNAQRNHRFKKTLANTLLFKHFIKNAAAIQFLTQKEKKDTKIKYKKAIISGNGFDCKAIKLPTTPKAKNYVYIGRYDKQHKGLDLIIKMCKEKSEWFRNNKVHIILYGRDSVNTKKELIEDTVMSGISDIIQVNGEVYNSEKEAVLAKSYAFIQTSRYEGQPMGVIEALSYGIPCIVTYGTSFGEYVNTHKCGVGVNFDVQELFSAIKKMSDDIALRNQCSNNTCVIKRDYSWEQILKTCIIEYMHLIKENVPNVSA